MMAVPFFSVFLGYLAILAGRRGIAIGFWLVGVVVMLVLFRLHATDHIKISL